MDAENPDIQGIFTECNTRNDWDVALSNLNHEDINAEAKNLEEAHELLSLKQEYVLDKSILNGPANIKPK